MPLSNEHALHFCSREIDTSHINLSHRHPRSVGQHAHHGARTEQGKTHRHINI